MAGLLAVQILAVLEKLIPCISGSRLLLKKLKSASKDRTWWNLLFVSYSRESIISYNFLLYLSWVERMLYSPDSSAICFLLLTHSCTTLYSCTSASRTVSLVKLLCSSSKTLSESLNILQLHSVLFSFFEWFAEPCWLQATPFPRSAGTLETWRRARRPQASDRVSCVGGLGCRSSVTPTTALTSSSCSTSPTYVVVHWYCTGCMLLW